MRTVQRIESIRPGGDLTGRFAEYPLPELLIGILRGNLTGGLEVDLGAGNAIYFKDGVPVSVMLPSLGISLSEILFALGEIDQGSAKAVATQAQGSGTSQSKVVALHQLCPEGALRSAIRARARSEVVKLFDTTEASFRFSEGAPMPADAELTILQPLPLIYQGLLTARDRTPVRQFLGKAHGVNLRLSDTYPRGVDPFEWGPDVERAVMSLDQPMSVEQFMQRGLPPDLVAVVLTTLHLADMVVLTEDLPVRAPQPGEPTLQPRLRPASVSGRATSRPAPVAPEAVVPIASPIVHVGPLTHEAQRAAVAKRLGPLIGKSYFEILRVTFTTKPDQIERAERYFIKMADGKDDPGLFALAGLATEAKDLLLDPNIGPRYKKVAQSARDDPKSRRERNALEVGGKVDRATRMMVDRARTGEADYLLEWAAQLDPSRQDLRLHRAFLGFCRAAPADRGKVATALRSMLASEATNYPDDEPLQLYLGIVGAELADRSVAEAVYRRVRDKTHPLATALKNLLDPSG